MEEEDPVSPSARGNDFSCFTALALETSREPPWDSVSLYSSFQGFQSHCDGCLRVFTLLCSRVALGDDGLRRPQTFPKAGPGELTPLCPSTPAPTALTVFGSCENCEAGHLP